MVVIFLIYRKVYKNINYQGQDIINSPMNAVIIVIIVIILVIVPEEDVDLVICVWIHSTMVVQVVKVAHAGVTLMVQCVN